MKVILIVLHENITIQIFHVINQNCVFVFLQKPTASVSMLGSS